MLAHSVCAAPAWCPCVNMHQLIHHYPPPKLPTDTTHFLPTSPSLFPLTHSLSFSHTPSPHPATSSEGSAEEESSLAVGHQWLTLSDLVQTQWTQPGISKGAQVQQCHSKSLAYSTTLKKIIYFTDSVGIEGCTVADCEKYMFFWKKHSNVGKCTCVAPAIFSQSVYLQLVRPA